MSLSKNKIKFIHSLELKKNRKAHKIFLAEGPKLVGELLGRMPCRFLAGTAEWLEQNRSLPAEEVIQVTTGELACASLQKTPQQVLAIFEQPELETDATAIRHSLCIALDGIQDPGNLGTIIRLADWFGIEQIFCSPNTVDVYSPKAIQATMGSIARVKLHYTSLPALIQPLKDCPIYGTFLDGANLYEETLTPHGLIVMGNEGNGIGQEVAQLVNRRLCIPPYPAGRETTESLNVAIATAVVCAEFRRWAAYLQSQKGIANKG